MSTLHDELAGLTSAQPTQPADRLTAVTGRARALRRRRAAAAGLAVLALGVAGAGVVQLAEPAPVRYVATPADDWPDRSEPDAEDLGFSAFTEWFGPEDGTDAHLRWLYRGVVRLPAGAKVVADFIATKDYVTYLVQAEIDRSDLADNGTVLDPTRTWGYVTTLDLATVRTAPSHLEHHFSDARSSVVVDLESPTARRVGWRFVPVPYAPPSPDGTSGTISSDDGVFLVDVGPLTGPLTVTDPAGRAHPVTPVELAAPEAFDGQGSFFSSAGTGTTFEDEHGAWLGGGTTDVGTVTGRRSVDLRCYGGGMLTVTLRAYDQDLQAKGNPEGRVFASSSVPCNGATWTRAVASTPVSGKGLEVTLRGDRLQAFAYRVTRD